MDTVDISSRASEYAGGKAVDCLTKAIEQAYKDGYLDGFKDGKELASDCISTGEVNYVDLGLPSGTLWATCNIGADASEEYGDYFAWGETQPKNYYSWGTYLYCNGGQSNLTKYCTNNNYGYNGFVDNLTTLLPEDDAATANWGVGWRMPTWEEWQELIDNTINTWVIQNGVNGRLFTASNGNSIFLPAAGYIYDDHLSNVGNWGDYWSSSLFSTPYSARACRIEQNYCGSNPYTNYRRLGRSVRPVRSPSKK